MPGVLCEHCSGLCCRYIALPIDEPDTKAEFDDVRWYLLHGGVSVFVEDGDWYLNIETDCRHLLPDYSCGIYDTRPQICRDYSTDSCEYHAGEYGYDRHFLTPENLAEYEREALRPKRAAKSRKKRRRGLRVKLGAGKSRRGSNGDALETDGRGVPLPVLGTWR